MALVFYIYKRVCTISKDIGIDEAKEICLSNKEYIRSCRFERTNVAYKCKIFEAFNLTLHWHYTHVCRVSKVIGINS